MLRCEGPYAKANPFRFATKFTDEETGLSYYGYRFYSPSLGRFINQDPIGEDGGLNLHGFAENDPMNGGDVLGLDHEEHLYYRPPVMMAPVPVEANRLPPLDIEPLRLASGFQQLQTMLLLASGNEGEQENAVNFDPDRYRKPDVLRQVNDTHAHRAQQAMTAGRRPPKLPSNPVTDNTASALNNTLSGLWNGVARGFIGIAQSALESPAMELLSKIAPDSAIVQFKEAFVREGEGLKTQVEEGIVSVTGADNKTSYIFAASQVGGEFGSSALVGGKLMQMGTEASLLSKPIPAAERLAGSGPAAGVLEVSSLRPSVGAMRNYNPGKAIEYVFDPATERFVVGAPHNRLPLYSPHENLAKLIGAEKPVGGMFTRGANGEFMFNEFSGHYWQNWNAANRTQFINFMETRLGGPIKFHPGM